MAQENLVVFDIETITDTDHLSNVWRFETVSRMVITLGDDFGVEESDGDRNVERWLGESVPLMVITIGNGFDVEDN